MLPPDDQLRRHGAIEAHFERQRPHLGREPELIAKARQQLKAFIESDGEGALWLRRALHPTRPAGMPWADYCTLMTARVGAWHEILAFITQEEPKA